jgi:hypothetical protein
MCELLRIVQMAVKTIVREKDFFVINYPTQTALSIIRLYLRDSGMRNLKCSATGWAGCLCLLPISPALCFKLFVYLIKKGVFKKYTELKLMSTCSRLATLRKLLVRKGNEHANHRYLVSYD